MCLGTDAHSRRCQRQRELPYVHTGGTPRPCRASGLLGEEAFSLSGSRRDCHSQIPTWFQRDSLLRFWMSEV